MSILDLRGPEFLNLYGMLVAGAATLGLLFRYLLRRPFDLPPANYNLDHYKTAFLAGHVRGAIDSAIAALVHRRVLKAWDGRPPVLKMVDPLPDDSAAIERAVYNGVSPGFAGSNLRDVRQAAKPTAERLGETLVRYELVLSPERYLLARLAPVILLGVCLALGIAKICIGLSRDRPVLFLIALCVLTFITAVLMFQRCHRRTVRGTRLLHKLRDQNDPLRLTALTSRQTLPYTDMALAFALYGPAIIPPSDQDLRAALRPQQGGSNSCGSSSCGSSSCGSSSSCGGSSGCGGGGGCGGCGGGGCGG
jgi:uncharacterized protein (TIGR04222 family)